jgi:hypothetical protein
MPNEVIDRLHVNFRRQNAFRGLVFVDRNQPPTQADIDCEDDADDDSTYAPSVVAERDDEFDEVNDVHGGDVVDNVVRVMLTTSSTTLLTMKTFRSMTTTMLCPGRVRECTTTLAILRKNPGVHPGETAGVHPDNVNDDGHDGDDAITNDQLEDEFDQRYGRRTNRYHLRRRRHPIYNLINVVDAVDGSIAVETEVGMSTIEGIDNKHKDIERVEEVLATPQMRMKAGLKMFGEDGAMAVKKELYQPHDRKVMAHCHKKDLTPDQRRDALGYLMFLKRKRWGKVKGRGCADVRK